MSEENQNLEEKAEEIVAESIETSPITDEVNEPVEIQAPKPSPIKIKNEPQAPKYATPIAVTSDDIVNSLPAALGPAVVSDNEFDYVRLGSIVYKNIHARKSLSVHHLQRRLNELGYSEAFADKDGFYGDKTKEAVGRFQGDNNLLGAGIINRETLDLLFLGDPNVVVID